MPKAPGNPGRESRRLPLRWRVAWGLAVCFVSLAPACSHDDPAGENETKVAASVQATPASPLVRKTLTLEGGKAVFWKDESTTSTALLYELEVKERASELRVGIDGIGTDPGAYELVVVDPTGSPRGREVGAASREVFVPSPEQGTWRVRVAQASPGREGFVMRARLEISTRNAPDGRAPNLRLHPPFAFHTQLPEPISGSCWPEEGVPDDRMCVRFAVGPENVGDSPLVLSLLRKSEELEQRLVVPGKPDRVRAAGHYVFHPAHGHYHIEDFIEIELFKRLNHDLRRVGSGEKLGFCFHDFRLTHWHQFLPNPPKPESTTCSPGGLMRLSPGWMEVYPRDTIDNFVSLPAGAEGRFLVRVVVDPARRIAESIENDNTSFAWIRLRGGRLRVLARGYGSGLTPRSDA